MIIHNQKFASIVGSRHNSSD